MKKLTISRQLLYLLIVLLVVTNLVTVGSVLSFIGQNKQSDNQEIVKEIPASHRVKFFTDELKLDEDQQYVFRELNRSFNQSANMIKRDLSHLRLDLVDELGRSHSDTIRIQVLSGKIGDLHTKLKMLTSDYYLGLKAVCSDEQKDILFHLFRNLLNDEDDIKTPRGRGSGGRGYGRQSSNQSIN